MAPSKTKSRKKPDIESQLEQLIRKQKATEKALAKANAQR
jgi:hypothetical protein